MAYAGRVEYAQHRKIRERNKVYYRVLHCPIWIFVFFVAPGPWTFQLFARGFSRAHALWLGIVLLGVAAAGFAGELPGVEPKPYILRFNEDKPNPWYRRICYTFAWNALLNFALLNLTGLLVAVLTGRWILKTIYDYGYFPLLALVLVLAWEGVLPRAKTSTRGEGTERRYFYGAVWSITLAQVLGLVLWKTLPRGHWGDLVKLVAYIATLVLVAISASGGLLPRTRPILPGELMIAD
jgi:hypothetical protein